MSSERRCSSSTAKFSTAKHYARQDNHGGHDPISDKRQIAQEPGVGELRDGRVMMCVRSDAGSQLISHSLDGGETWSALVPSALRSPTTSATIERVPGSETLVCVWNDHANVATELRAKRTPLSLAIRQDEGESWQPSITLCDNPNRWYYDTAIEFTKQAILLGRCVGDRTKNNGLAQSHVTRFELDAFREKNL